VKYLTVWLSFSQGIVLFAHGSGSSRMSPRNRMVAKMLQDMGEWGGALSKITRGWWCACDAAKITVETIGSTS